MATVRDIVNGALRRIGAIGVAEEAEAEVADIALAAYNGLMLEARVAGWIEAFTAQGFNDTITLTDEQTEPLKAAVGERIAADFGLDVLPSVRRDARMFHAQLAAAGYSPATFERGVRFEDAGDEYVADV